MLRRDTFSDLPSMERLLHDLESVPSHELRLCRYVRYGLHQFLGLLKLIKPRPAYLDCDHLPDSVLTDGAGDLLALLFARKELQRHYDNLHQLTNVQRGIRRSSDQTIILQKRLRYATRMFTIWSEFHLSFEFRSEVALNSTKDDEYANDDDDDDDDNDDENEDEDDEKNVVEREYERNRKLDTFDMICKPPKPPSSLSSSIGGKKRCNNNDDDDDDHDDKTCRKRSLFDRLLRL